MALDLLKGQDYSISKAGAKKFGKNALAVAGLGLTIVAGLAILNQGFLPLAAKIPFVGERLAAQGGIRTDGYGTVA